MRRFYHIWLLIVLFCLGCGWHLRPADSEANEPLVTIDRYDQTERLFLSTGDYAALQQLKTDYPQQTRALIEDVLHLGLVSDSDINVRFLTLFQDTALQAVLTDTDRLYADMSDEEQQLSEAFRRLQTLVPDLQIPRVYTQIGSLDQSIVVGDGLLGISLDKYLGEDYPLYLKFDYSPYQRHSMTRQFIVPDCLSFYLLSLYPLADFESATADERHWHIAKIQHVVNLIIDRRLFDGDMVRIAAERAKTYERLDIDALMALPL